MSRKVKHARGALRLILRVRDAECEDVVMGTIPIFLESREMPSCKANGVGVGLQQDNGIPSVYVLSCARVTLYIKGSAH